MNLEHIQTAQASHTLQVADAGRSRILSIHPFVHCREALTETNTQTTNIIITRYPYFK